MKLLKFFAAIVLLVSGVGAQAATYYVSDCQAGAASGCVAGNNANWPTLAQDPATPAKDCGFLTSHYAALQPGDQVLFARGGSFTGCATVFLDNANVTTKAGRIYIGSYTPSWDYTTCTYTSGPKAPWVATPCIKPLIASTTGTVFWFGENFQVTGPVHRRFGPIIDGLHLTGNSVDAGFGCLHIGTATDYFEIKNSELESCYNGIDSQVSSTFGSIASGNGMSNYTWVHDNYVHDTVHNGFYGAAQYLVLEHNIFDKCGNTRIFDHCIYAGGVKVNSLEVTTYGTVIRGNSTSGNTYYTQTGTHQCESVILVVHGLHDGITIEGNDLIEDTPPSGTYAGNCYGIGPAPGYDNATPEAFNHMVIRWNRIVNVAACIMPDSMTNSMLEDNACYSTYNGATNGITWRSGLGVPYDRNKAHDTNNTVRNNTVYFTLPSANVTPLGMKFNEWDGAAGIGSNNKVVSNLIYLGTGTSSTTNCISRVANPGGASFSVTIANPGVFTYVSHGLATNQPMFFAGTSAPGGFSLSTVYYPVNVTTDTWQLASTPSGTGIQATSSGSGVTVKRNVLTFTNGSTNVGYVAHGLVVNQQVQLTNTPGTLPSAFTSGNWYFVKTVVDANTVTLSATKGGAAITSNATNTGSVVRATDPSAFAAMDRNLCYFSGTAGVWDTPSGSLSNWRTYSGLDLNSLTTNPTITAPSSPTYSVCPSGGSPAISAGHPTLSSEFAYRGFMREGTPDIGACQSGASKVVPYSPVMVH